MFTPQIFYCNVEECKHVVALKEQIKQLELENKRLKEDEKSLLNVIDDLQKTKNEWQEKYGDLGQDFDQLQAENDSLKRQLKFEFDETLSQYSNTIEDLQKQLNNTVMQKCPQCGEIYLNPIGAKLYNTLAEIKEIVEQGVKIHDDIIVSKQILQKISECEGNDELNK